MKRTLFIGDSHTCGYDLSQEFRLWHDNNYCESYYHIHNKPALVYACPGVPFRMYTEWLTTMFKRYSDIDQVFLCLAPFNRFILAGDDPTDIGCVPTDNFIVEQDPKNAPIQRFWDKATANDRMQLFQKTTYEDYEKIPACEFSDIDGLIEPDIRKNSFMEVKLFMELNTFLEKREYFNSIYTWDNICNDNGADLYIFNFRDRMRFPEYNNYYGKLKRTVFSPKTVEMYFKNKHIDHEKYFMPDNEHYTKDFHDMIAEQFIPWLEKQKKY